MTKTEQKTWTKPQLTRLGTIADVAGANTNTENPVTCDKNTNVSGCS